MNPVVTGAQHQEVWFEGFLSEAAGRTEVLWTVFSLAGLICQERGSVWPMFSPGCFWTLTHCCNRGHGRKGRPRAPVQVLPPAGQVSAACSNLVRGVSAPTGWLWRMETVWCRGKWRLPGEANVVLREQGCCHQGAPGSGGTCSIVWATHPFYLSVQSVHVFWGCTL